MSFGIKTFEHAVAVVASDIVKVAKKISSVIPIVQGTETTVETITSVIDPLAVPLERAAYASLGILAKVVNDIPTLTSANTTAPTQATTITLDVEFINELKALLPALKAQFAAQGIKV